MTVPECQWTSTSKCTCGRAWVSMDCSRVSTNRPRMSTGVHGCPRLSTVVLGHCPQLPTNSRRKCPGVHVLSTYVRGYPRLPKGWPWLSTGCPRISADVQGCPGSTDTHDECPRRTVHEYPRLYTTVHGRVHIVLAAAVAAGQILVRGSVMHQVEK